MTTLPFEAGRAFNRKSRLYVCLHLSEETFWLIPCLERTQQAAAFAEIAHQLCAGHSAAAARFYKE